MIERVKEGGEEAALSASTAPVNTDSAETPAVDRETEEDRRSREDALKKARQKDVLDEPGPFEFTVELPNVTAVDL
jgi:hypothetical protein